MLHDIKAVIFDWAGTMIDFGCFAPTLAFVDVFAAFDIEVSVHDARRPMGLPKRAHVETMFDSPDIKRKWQTRYGHMPTQKDINHLYEAFIPINETVAADHAALVPGALPMLKKLDQRKIKIGSTTGYTRSIMEKILPIAAAQGYQPLNCVCSNDLIEGRPGPLGMYQCMVDLGVYPPHAVVKVDDTAPGIAEGVAAGCQTVGVALSSNYVGLTYQEVLNLSRHEVDEIRTTTTEKLQAAGADYVIDTIADLPSLLG